MSTPSTAPLPAGWYPDPAGGPGRRWHDGQGWTGEISFGRPPGSPRPLDHGFAKLSDWLCRLLWLCMGISVLTLAIHLWEYAAPENLTPAGAPEPGTLTAHLLVTALVGLLAVLAMLVTGVLWLVWQYQAARSATGARRSPGMHVVGWFIPFANLFMVPQNLADLCRVYPSPKTTADVKDLAATPGLVYGWWLAWMAASVMQGFALVAGLSVKTTADQQWVALLGGFEELLVALSAALAATLVRALSWQALLAHTAVPENSVAGEATT